MRWYIIKEKQKGVERNTVRAWDGTRYLRLPVKDYKRIRDNDVELEAFVKRKNAPLDAAISVDFKHAFLNESLYADYLAYLTTKIPTASVAKTEWGYVKRYFINYYVGVLNLINPADWHKHCETKWAAFLLSEDAPASAKTKRDIVNAANRFVKWLHKRRPEDMPLNVFEPISKSKYRDIEARREMSGDKREPQLISKDHRKHILGNLPASIAPYIKLMALYGLRRGEALGIKPGDVKNSYLTVERQLIKLGQYKPPKGKDARKVPHWSCSAAEAYILVEACSKLPMHPRTFAERWDIFMSKLNMDYCLHDWRHTYLTDMVRLHEPRDVQLAAGHKDIRITMAYLHDDREMGDQEYKPGA